MKRLFIFIKICHQVTLLSLLFVLALIPVLIDTDIVTAFVIIPSILLVVFSISLVIDHQLTKFQGAYKQSNNKNRPKFKSKSCPIKNVLCNR